MRTKFFLIIFCIQCILTNAQFYKAIPKKYLLEKSYKKEYKKEYKRDLNIYDLTHSLPKNYVEDGSEDYTIYLQKAIDTYKNVIFPDFKILTTGLKLNSNSVIIFREKSKLIMKSSSSSGYQVLKIHNLENVELYSPVIEGDKLRHIGNKGEWGMGISVKSSKNIKIINPKIFNCWGDGIYVGGGGKCSENVSIVNGVIDGNRRNGISLTNVNGIIIFNTVITNTSGTQPMCGIDIEPNSNDDVINNITIKNCITFNNKSHGILIMLKKLKGKNKKNVDINIINNIDDNSGHALGFFMTGKKDKGKQFSGKIKIENNKWINNIKKSFFNYNGSTMNGVKLFVKDITIDDNSNKINFKKTLKTEYNIKING